MTKRDEILEKYLKVCKDASRDEDVFETFKVHPDYKEVLEHLSKRLGQRHYELIRKNNPQLLEIENIFDNDKYGTPDRENYAPYLCSPTTMQYISVVSNLIDLYGSLYGFKIIELGGGYGGQAYITRRTTCLGEYDIIDLEECGLLQRKYLQKLGMAVNTYSPTDIISKQYDLFISNYALSEVSGEDQLNYVKSIVLKCKKGYITCNQPLNGMDLIKKKFKTFKISKDIEGERVENFLITW